MAYMSDEEYRWRSDDAQLESLLNVMLSEYGPSGADPHPAGTAAAAAVEKLGGRILKDTPPPRRAGVIY